MSLCPDYCDCRTCKHGIKDCDPDGCRECRAEYIRIMEQGQHDESVRRQRAKLKIAKWNIGDAK